MSNGEKMIDEKDRKILSLMNSNPGISRKELAEKVGLAENTTTLRLQRLKGKKLLLGKSPIIALDRIGYDITVALHVTVAHGKLGEAAHKWSKDANVCSLYRISGDYDLLIIAKFHNTKEVDEWNQKIFADTELIERTSTSIVFGIEKEGTNPGEIT